MSDENQRADEALATVDRCWAAYEANSPEFFDFFTEDASIFSTALPLRLQGRETYRRFFGPQLGQQRRASHIFDPEVRLLGDGALVSYHSRVRTKYNALDNRITLLLVPDGELLKIAHMHISPLSSPSTTATSGLIEDIVELAAAPPEADR